MSSLLGCTEMLLVFRQREPFIPLDSPVGSSDAHKTIDATYLVISCGAKRFGKSSGPNSVASITNIGALVIPIGTSCLEPDIPLTLWVGNIWHRVHRIFIFSPEKNNFNRHLIVMRRTINKSKQTGPHVNQH